MSRVAFLLALLIAAPAQAQFKLPDLNINKLIDTAKGVVKATREIDENEEIAIGSDVAARLLGAAPLMNDLRVQRYVNNVGRWLATQSERPDLPWHFGVMDERKLNAFAVPGGPFFFNRGLPER